MPDDGDNASVKVELDGSHLRVDARPARLVSQLRGGDGEPVVTAQAHGGGGVSEAVPAAARQVTMRVSEELSVEATRAADFVALADEASGRRLVVAFTGEVTVLPNGASGDRFALSAHEALLVPAGGGDPRVVPLAELSDDEQGEITSAVEAASLAAPAAKVTPEPVKAAAETKPAEPKTEAPAADATTGDIVPGDTKRAGAAPVTKTGAAKAGAGAGAGGGGGRPGEGARRGKKGKKGRPQPPPGKKAAPLVPAAAGGAAAAASAAKKGTTPPIKKATTAPAKKTTTGGPSKGGGANRGGGGGGGRGGKPPAGGGGDRRFVLGAIAVAALVGLVLGVFVLTGDDDPGETIGANSTTTSSAADDTTTTAAPTPTTTAPAAATTTARPTATTTTARPATTTTAKPPIAADYAIEPKTCVQNGNSVTYTAAVTNKASAAFDFTIRVVFKDASGAAVASSDAAVNKVGTGKTVDFTATGTSAKTLANSGASCTVERVDARQSGS